MMQQRFQTLLRTTTLAMLAALSASAAQAHGIWFAQRSGQLALVYGHGPEDLAMIPRLGKVTGIHGFDAAGQRVPTRLKATDHLAFVDAQPSPAYVAATLDNGYWSQTADGQWVGKGRDEVPGARVSGRYLKHALHLTVLPTGPVPALPAPGVQVLPVSTPFPQQMGQPLTLKVLRDGQPVAQAKVWADYVNDPDATPLHTDRNGTITLPVRNQGLNVIKVEVESPSPDAAKATLTAHTATLSFALPHKPE